MDYNDYPESKCLIDHIEERMRMRKGCNFLFTGGVGDGKSFAGARLLELWYRKHFNEPFPISHVCNSITEAIILASSFKRLGEGLMIEELSAHAGRREALTISNREFNKFLDIIRIKQIVMVGNAPHISFIDKHIFMMAQSWVNCELVNFKQQVVVAHPLHLETSPYKSEPYKHKYLDEDGDKIETCHFNLPDKKFVEDYNKLKNVANESILDESILKLQHTRMKQLKEWGQKVLPKKLLEAYTYHLQGYTDEEATKKMKLKNLKAFRDYRYSAKKLLKQPEYQQYAKEMAKLDKTTKKL